MNLQSKHQPFIKRDGFLIKYIGWTSTLCRKPVFLLVIHSLPGQPFV
ncbi:hypothetical protein QY97_03141 [Bacillus thermotolerans]|uniref:Uncharacterized protein n=1 Tax=Bacillus thermotolerans TaxID=1221996 RepID=A0A0F5HKU0_BACTR|nr:hypothetical protein QY97_03141 [Bacillus thermotolerans]KKB41785.1 hypothetical protein QY95_00592 [Bacillus thermotolerans]KKB44322.1 hypothetical protein QY96_02922 [Bacillus thermotolerans]